MSEQMKPEIKMEDRMQAISMTMNGKTKWFIPRRHVAIMLMPERASKKLEKWLKAHDDLELAADRHGRLHIFNRTKIDRYKQRKKTENKN